MGTISTRWCNLLPKPPEFLSNGEAVPMELAMAINQWHCWNLGSYMAFCFSYEHVEDDQHLKRKTTNDCPPLPDFNVMTSSSRPAHVVSNTICYSLERVLNPWRKYPNKSMGNSPSINAILPKVSKLTSLNGTSYLNNQLTSKRDELSIIFFVLVGVWQ